MTDKERREEDILKNCIQEAYGLSDEQLLAELEEIEATLSDDEFEGVEERIYERIVEREALSVSDKNPVSESAPIRKLRKNKKWLIVGLAAVLVVGAGVTTIGDSNYFLRRDRQKKGIVLDSAKNILEAGTLKEAYDEIEEQLESAILKLNYLPEGMLFEKLEINDGRATMIFSYDKQKVYFIQEKRNINRSIGINSDRIESDIVIENKWIEEEILLEKNILNKGKCEYSILIYTEDMSYRLLGIFPEKEIIKIAENLNF